MTKTTVSRADALFWGQGATKEAFTTYPGAPLTPARVKVALGSPVAADPEGYAASQSVAAAGALVLDGALVGVSDVARNVTITSAGVDTGITFTVTGGDVHGGTVVETITGASAGVAAGAKAFKTVSSIEASGAAASTVTAGTGDVLGLPFAAANAASIPSVWFNDAIDGSATVVLADATEATATTGDTRGTVDPSSACDGSPVEMEMYPDGSSEAGLHGVAQYSG